MNKTFAAKLLNSFSRHLFKIACCRLVVKEKSSALLNWTKNRCHRRYFFFFISRWRNISARAGLIEAPLWFFFSNADIKFFWYKFSIYQKLSISGFKIKKVTKREKIEKISVWWKIFEPFFWISEDMKLSKFLGVQLLGAQRINEKEYFGKIFFNSIWSARKTLVMVFCET